MLWTYLKWRISVFAVNPLVAVFQPWLFWFQRRSWTRLSTTTSLTTTASLTNTTRLSTITKISLSTRLCIINRLSKITRLAITTSLATISSVSSLISESSNEVFNMEISKPLAANACGNQKSLSPNQLVNFKNPKRRYTKTAVDNFNLSGMNNETGCTITKKRTV